MDEIWKDIKGYEGYYKVSNKGRVKRLSKTVKGKNNTERRIKEKILKGSTSWGRGYHTINLFIENEFKCFKVHRLVAISFIPNEKNKPEVNHIDGNKLNNQVNNLEWVTHKENYAHASKKRLLNMGEDHYKSVLTKSDVVDIKNRYESGMTQSDLSDMYGVGQSHISKLVNKKTWKHI